MRPKLTYEEVVKEYELMAELAVLDASGPPDDWMPKVLDMFYGLPRALFWDMDDNPYTLGIEVDGKEWHYKLRQVRNHRLYGPRLFDGLR